MGKVLCARGSSTCRSMRGRIMSNNSYEVRLKIASLHPVNTAEELVEQLLQLTPELSNHIKDLHPGVTVEADREKSIPIDPVSAYLVLKFVGGALAAGALKKLGEDAYTFLKKKIKNGTVGRPEAS